jgi:hypothetical protein
MTALVEKLEIENAKLISQVARGDFNPATTKVFAFVWFDVCVCEVRLRMLDGALQVLRMQGNPLGPPVSEDVRGEGKRCVGFVLTGDGLPLRRGWRVTGTQPSAGAGR